MILTLATNNLHKRDELLAVLRRELGDQVTIKTLDEAGLHGIDIPETGETLEENALIKARAIHALTNEPTLADDTGLAVHALNGAPGVYSARYAGENVSYADNVNKLLSEMAGQQKRNAEFRTVIAFIDANNEEHLFEGSVEGLIMEKPRGTNGFGYDPVFEPNESGGKTFAEMDSESKNRISHRGRAIEMFARFLSKKM